MNKEDVKKGYLAAMATMEVEPMYAEQYWESYEASQYWPVKNHGVSHHVGECSHEWSAFNIMKVKCSKCGAVENMD